MKKIILLPLLCLLMINCSQPNNTPVVPVIPPTPTNPNPPVVPPTPTTAKLLFSGDFTGVSTGKASVYSEGGKNTVVLDPFNVRNGPDLRVYYSKDANLGDYTSLGKLQATTSKQTYTIPSTLNPSDYHYVFIWCQQFSVNYGTAELK